MKQTVKNICLALLWCFMSLHITAQGVVINKADGTKDYYKASEVLSVGVYGYGENPEPDPGTDPDPNGHEWVDLGLPSGTLWATCNVGANNPEEYGDYFAWGEIEPKEVYKWETYKYSKDSYNTLTKYCHKSESGYNGFTDNLRELEPEDDAATANWGSDWQIPSPEQCRELINSSYITTEWVMQNGINGCKITSKSNGKSIFLPATGDCYGNSPKKVGTHGYYWLRSNDYDYPSNGQVLWFYEDMNGCSMNGDGRSWGVTIRPVRIQN